MNQNDIEKYVNKQVRLYQKDDKTFWTGIIKDVNPLATTIKDKFGRLVTVENAEIKTISEWS
ncbi:hypothetical protein HOA91_02735 [Candidatus Woesearchaeota archaeon]|jgi:hypothetical protein|nr:hypothetical protein [Candidatus Woesearchaeota archaeon]